MPGVIVMGIVVLLGVLIWAIFVMFKLGQHEEKIEYIETKLKEARKVKEIP